VSWLIPALLASHCIALLAFAFVPSSSYFLLTSWARSRPVARPVDARVVVLLENVRFPFW
jgi:hypothetical protein